METDPDILFKTNYVEEKVERLQDVLESNTTDIDGTSFGSLQELDEHIGRTVDDILERKRGDMSKVQYKTVKAFVHELERNNQNYLVAYSNKKRGWIMLGGASALFYAYDIGVHFKTPPTINIDSDLDFKFDEGVCFVHDFSSLFRRLRDQDIRDWAKVADDVWLIKLPRRYSKKEVERFRKLDRQLYDEIRNLVLPKNRYPDFFGMLVKNTSLTYNALNKMDGNMKEAIGRDLFKIAVVMMERYVDMSNGIVEILPTLEELRRNAIRISSLLSVMLEQRIVDKKTLSRLARLNVDIRTKIQQLRKENSKQKNAR